MCLQRDNSQQPSTNKPQLVIDLLGLPGLRIGSKRLPRRPASYFIYTCTDERIHLVIRYRASSHPSFKRIRQHPNHAIKRCHLPRLAKARRLAGCRTTRVTSRSSSDVPGALCRPRRTPPHHAHIRSLQIARPKSTQRVTGTFYIAHDNVAKLLDYQHDCSSSLLGPPGS